MFRRWSRAAVVLVVVVLAATACGGDDEPELTVEERLAIIEGRALTPAEVNEKLSVGAALCRLDDPVLDELWQRLDAGQLPFQDFVFGELCPDRATLYAGHTGRYVTEEAEQSGVVTSTTRSSSAASTAITGATNGPGSPEPTLGSETSDLSDQASSSTVEGAPSTTAPDAGGTSTPVAPSESTTVGEGG